MSTQNCAIAQVGANIQNESIKIVRNIKIYANAQNVVDNECKCVYNQNIRCANAQVIAERRINMFANLDREIGANGMSWRTVASAINMPESTFRSKITSGNFTIDEAFNIKNIVFPKYALEYLFAKTDDKSA